VRGDLPRSKKIWLYKDGSYKTFKNNVYVFTSKLETGPNAGIRAKLRHSVLMFSTGTKHSGIPRFRPSLQL